jgi:hypothetical protein
MMEAAPSSETSVLTRFTRRKIPVGGIFEHLRQFSFLVVGCCTSNRIVVLNVLAPIRDKTGNAALEYLDAEMEFNITWQTITEII